MGPICIGRLVAVGKEMGSGPMVVTTLRFKDGNGGSVICGERILWYLTADVGLISSPAMTITVSSSWLSFLYRFIF